MGGERFGMPEQRITERQRLAHRPAGPDRRRPRVDLAFADGAGLLGTDERAVATIGLGGSRRALRFFPKCGDPCLGLVGRASRVTSRQRPLRFDPRPQREQRPLVARLLAGIDTRERALDGRRRIVEVATLTGPAPIPPRPAAA